MLELIFAPGSPNGRKVTIMLEECGMEYRTRSVNITAGEQFDDDFLRLNPNAKIPVLIDHSQGEDFSIFESGAILLYLGRKSGQFLPTDERGYYEALQWVFWQMANFGPVTGHGNHFITFAPEDNPYAVQRFTREYRRLLAVLNYQLKRGSYLAGDYSIADMSVYPWLYNREKFIDSLEEFPQLNEWYQRLSERPALKRGMDLDVIPGWKPEHFVPDEKIRKIMFEQDDSRYTGKSPQ